MLRSRLVLVPLLMAMGLVIGSCSDTGTNTQLGSGTTLQATINGTAVSFTLADIGGFNTYTAATQETMIGGTNLSTTTRTLTLRFNYDLDHGSFPHTLPDDSVSVVYLEESGGTNLTYTCPPGSGNCSITLTGYDGTTVAGSFHAALADPTDSTRTATITNGTFSARLRRL